jgi:PHP family Zn ribbon phosphoesterase
MLKEFQADLHIHTCLSPCGDLTMSPTAIVAQAGRRRIDLIAICDHNSSENSGAVIEASEGSGITVLPGLEVTSKEEVHVCALFDRLDRALQLQAIVYDHLEGENDEQAFGMQVVVDAKGWVTDFNRRLLIGATGLSIEQVVSAIHALGGLAVASHVDREGFGIIGQLGFVPPGLALDGLEVSPHLTLEQARQRFAEYQAFAFVRSSDAHHPDQIGQATTAFWLEAATVRELRMALRGEAGRKIAASP